MALAKNMALCGIAMRRSDAYQFPMMAGFGKWLVIGGLVMVATGLVLWTGFGKSWLGRLPGDFQFSRGDSTFRFPLATCLVLSLLLTAIVNLLLWLLRR